MCAMRLLQVFITEYPKLFSDLWPRFNLFERSFLVTSFKFSDLIDSLVWSHFH